MRLLLSSTDRQQIDGLARILTSAGIPSEIHIGWGANAQDWLLANWELWLQNDDDYHTAAILCAGFVRRQGQAELCQHN
jgi:hypothetical protein